ncbi:MAG: deoxynucleoside kinase [Nitrospinae bacterium]|nr:deoxynucleoside kinase [Nitrospinota bacterium]
MNAASRYIAVEGPIGVGKSSLVRLLAQRLETEPVFEEVDENPFLGPFYKDRKSYAFQTQIFFLMSRFRQLSALAQVDLFNRTALADYFFDRDMVFARLNLDPAEFTLYHEMYQLLSRRLPRPDLVVYLQADTPTLMRRIRQRGRDAENGVSEEYIDKVNKAFNEYFFGYKGGPLLIINTSQIDFVKNPGDLDQLMAKVTGTVRGVEFFNPPSSLF